jgi:plasmid stabilization system protein ParE
VRIERHDAVLADDLPCIYAFIARDNPAAAEDVLAAVEATFDRLARQPECGVLYANRNPAFASCGCCQWIAFQTTSSSIALRETRCASSTSSMAQDISPDFSEASQERDRQLRWFDAQ